MANDIILETRLLSKIYTRGNKKLKALDQVSMKIKKGCFIAIMGPSGSGKTTLLNMIGCLDRPTSGDIYLEGKNISKLNDNQLTEIRGNKIGFVFQAFNLIPTMSVLNNVILPMTFKGLRKSVRIERARTLLKSLGLENMISRYPSELSAGEQQRVAIARALVNNSAIILADEPTGNLDTITGEKIMNILSSLNNEGKTILLVTHDLSLLRYADKVISIVDGRVSKSEKL